MVKISWVIIFQILTLSAISQTTLFNPHFPANADRQLWDEALLLTKDKPFDEEKADYLLGRSLELLAENTEPQANLMVASFIADYVGSVGRNPVKGMEIFAASGELFIQQNDTLHIAWVHRYTMMAYNHVYTRNVEGIAVNFENAYNTLMAFDSNHPLVPSLQYNLMQSNFQVRKIVEGFAYFYPLIEYAEKNNDWLSMINAYLGAGNIIKFYNPGLSRQFLQYAHFLAMRYEVQQHLTDPFFYISQGSANTATDNHQEALELYKKGIDVLRKNSTNNKSLEGSFLYYIGVSYSNLGNYPQAIAYLDSAANLEKEIAGKTRSWHRMMGLKGKSLNFSGNFEAALEVNRQVHDFFAQRALHHESYYYQNSLQELMRSYSGLGDHENALAIGQKAIYHFLGMDVPDDLFVLPNFSTLISPDKNYLELELAIYLKIDIMRDMAANGNAEVLARHMLDHFAAATAITDIHSSVATHAETLSTMSSRFKLNANRLLDGLAGLNPDQNLMQDAYLMVARSKAYLLQAEKIRNRSTNQILTTAFESTEAKKQRQELETKLLQITPENNPIEWEAINQYLLLLEKERFVAGINNPRPSEPILQENILLSTFKSVNENIAENEIVTDFYLSEKHLHTFVITQDSFQFQTTPIPENFNNLTNGLFRSIKTGNVRNQNEQVNLLGRFLFDHINFHGKEHLIIVADEKLHALPFDILIYKTRPIIETMAISYRYSPHLFRKTEFNERGPIKSFLALAPVFDDQHSSSLHEPFEIADHEDYRDILRDGQYLTPIPATLHEVEIIGEKLSSAGIKTELLIRHEATKGNFLNQASEFDILHLATHGFADRDHPMQSGLALFDAQNQQEEFTVSLLMLGELSNTTLNADLVVLSACKSGYGNIQRGEGIMGISRGFIASGANNVLASLWKVHDEKTQEFMIDFYTFLMDGFSYENALQLTKLEKINKGWLTADWAGFILIKN